LLFNGAKLLTVRTLSLDGNLESKDSEAVKLSKGLQMQLMQTAQQNMPQQQQQQLNQFGQPMQPQQQLNQFGQPMQPPQQQLNQFGQPIQPNQQPQQLNQFGQPVQQGQPQQQLNQFGQPMQGGQQQPTQQQMNQFGQPMQQQQQQQKSQFDNNQPQFGNMQDEASLYGQTSGGPVGAPKKIGPPAMQPQGFQQPMQNPNQPQKMAQKFPLMGSAKGSLVKIYQLYEVNIF
jgi:hypothetical protein